MKANKDKWKQRTIFFMCISILMTAITSVLFLKSDYLGRVALKIGVGGGE